MLCSGSRAVACGLTPRRLGRTVFPVAPARHRRCTAATGGESTAGGARAQDGRRPGPSSCVWPGRTPGGGTGGPGSARPPPRCLDGPENPPRRRHRPGPAPLWPRPARGPHHPGRKEHRPRLPAQRHRAGQQALRVGVAQARHPSVAWHRRHRSPDPGWVVPQVRHPAADPGTRRGPPRFLPRDREGTYGAAFDTAVAADEMEILQRTPRAPRRNAHGGRTTGSIRRETLEPVRIRGKAHVRQSWPPTSGITPRTGPIARRQLPPDPVRQSATVHALNRRRPLRPRILGGVNSGYHYAA